MDESDSVRVTPPHLVATLTSSAPLSRDYEQRPAVGLTRKERATQKTANVHEPPADDGLMHVHRYCAEPLPLCAKLSSPRETAGPRSSRQPRRAPERPLWLLHFARSATRAVPTASRAVAAAGTGSGAA